MRFGRGTADEAGAILAERGFTGYALVTTERARASVPSLAEHADVVAIAPSGLVADIAGALRPTVAGKPLVALGGGRVIDTAKAIAAAERAERPEGVCAIPTTLSGAELTPIHRTLPGTTGQRVRPSLVICDPAIMASQPMPELAASAMNALAHACEACWLADGNPISDAIAERGAGLLTVGLEHVEPDRDALALGAVEAALAFGLTGVGVHHVVCQTLVQSLGLPHAATNAIILPHVFALMASRAPEAIGALDLALGGDSEERVRAVALRAGPTRLRELGRSLDDCLSCVAAMLSRPELARTPGIGEDDLVAADRGCLVKPKGAILRVEAALRDAGLDSEIVQTPDSARTAEEAAAAMGTSVGQIVKSLVFLCDGSPVLALVSGSNRLDTRLLGALAGGRIERADADAVRSATGYAIGGVPPIGHPAQLPTWVDRDLLAYDVIWAAAGTPHAVFPVAPADLVRASSGVVAEIKA